jgi:hypothetical protein
MPAPSSGNPSGMSLRDRFRVFVRNPLRELGLSAKWLNQPDSPPFKGLSKEGWLRLNKKIPSSAAQTGAKREPDRAKH